MRYLIGVVKNIEKKCLVVENNNLGYLIFTPIAENFEISKKYLFYIHQDVKIERNKIIFNFYGFLDLHYLNFFNFLLKIPGVGPKIALNILSNRLDVLINLIQHENFNELSCLPGINKKIANFLISKVKENDKKDPLLNNFCIYYEAKKRSILDSPQIKEILKDIGYEESEINWAINILKQEKKDFSHLNDAISKCITKIATENKH